MRDKYGGWSRRATTTNIHVEQNEPKRARGKKVRRYEVMAAVLGAPDVHASASHRGIIIYNI